jgi:hypothetical protein
MRLQPASHQAVLCSPPSPVTFVYCAYTIKITVIWAVRCTVQCAIILFYEPPANHSEVGLPCLRETNGLLEIDGRGITRSRCLANSRQKRLWTFREADYVMMMMMMKCTNMAAVQILGLGVALGPPAQDTEVVCGNRCLRMRLIFVKYKATWWPIPVAARSKACGFSAARLLGLRVRIPPRARMSFFCECCVL